MQDIITMAHGAGGEATRRLIESVFSKAFDNALLSGDDAAVLPEIKGPLAMTTDGFIVSPPFFNGGNIGKLSVCGTVNDLACMGAQPLYMTCSFIIEEGFGLDALKEIAKAMAKTAKEAGIAVVAGDTKVAPHGECGGCFITTTGVGAVRRTGINGKSARAGDAVIVTGDIGRHGCAILLGRGDYGIDAEIKSDCAPLWETVSSMLDASHQIHTIRDATRGGLGTVLNEIARESSQSGEPLCIEIDESAVPVDGTVSGVCGLLGLDPLYMACEGRMAVFAPQSEAQALLNAIKQCPYSENAAIIGSVKKAARPCVTVRTAAGGERLLPPPGGELLPRIC